MRSYFGEEAGLKLFAFIALVPLVLVNLYLIIAGVATATGSGFLSGLGWLVAFVGLVGLVAQVALMGAARGSPQGAGLTLGVIGLLVLLAGLAMRFAAEPIGLLMLLAPFPGSLLLIIAGWREAHAHQALMESWRKAR